MTKYFLRSTKLARAAPFRERERESHRWGKRQNGQKTRVLTKNPYLCAHLCAHMWARICTHLCFPLVYSLPNTGSALPYLRDISVLSLVERHRHAVARCPDDLGSVVLSAPVTPILEPVVFLQ